MEHLQCKICGADAAKFGKQDWGFQRGPFQLGMPDLPLFVCVKSVDRLPGNLHRAYYRGKGVDPWSTTCSNWRSRCTVLGCTNGGHLARVWIPDRSEARDSLARFWLRERRVGRYCAQNREPCASSVTSREDQREAASYGIPLRTRPNLMPMDGMLTW